MIVNGLHNNHIKMTKPILQNRKSVLLVIIVVLVTSLVVVVEIVPSGLFLFLNL